MIFVFESNEAGIHGAGAAKFALSKGAVMGVGFGRQGKTFAIPTKDWSIGHLELPVIQHYVERFIAYAEKHPDTVFHVTAIGCGLAGYKHSQIAPLFRHNCADALPNVLFDEAWKPYLCSRAKFWGTF